jgi:hypothetical protein
LESAESEGPDPPADDDPSPEERVFFMGLSISLDDCDGDEPMEPVPLLLDPDPLLDP